MNVILNNVYPDEDDVNSNLVLNTGLSNGAYRLYCIYLGLSFSSEIKDSMLISILKVSSRTITRWKRELKSYGLLVIIRTGSTSYSYVVGTLSNPASKEIEQYNIVALA